MARTDIMVPLDATADLPVVRRLHVANVWDALAKGFDDFRATPTVAAFACLIYPVVGLLLGRLMFSNDILPVLYPIVVGLALVGPFMAIGMYELSRRRALGYDTTWSHMLDVVHSPSLWPILGIGGLLMLLFGVWLAVAHGLYVTYLGPDEPLSASAFARDVLTTRDGQNMVVAGNLVGLVFAVAAMALSVFSLPLLVDRNVGVAVALTTSLKAVAANPGPMAVWGLVVGFLLLAGALPLLVGMAVVLPILGHATWHLYVAAIEPDERLHAAYRARPAAVKRYAADFPAVLFTLFMRGRSGDR